MGVALITGASSGVGREMARHLHRRGNEVVITARSAGALEELAAELGGAQVVVADLSQPEGVDAVVEAVERVDLLVNNAGFGDYGPFVKAERARLRGMVELNSAALTELTRVYLPSMVERHAGQILNVASTAAFLAGPEMAVYSATKAFVLSFSEAIAEEVRGTGVTVTAFCPGAFSSGFQDAAGAGARSSSRIASCRAQRRWRRQRSSRSITRRWSRSRAPSTRSVRSCHASPLVPCCAERRTSPSARPEHASTHALGFERAGEGESDECVQ